MRWASRGTDQQGIGKTRTLEGLGQGLTSGLPVLSEKSVPWGPSWAGRSSHQPRTTQLVLADGVVD